MMMNIFDELKWRGLIYQASDGVEERLKTNKPIILYNGYDPTAKSLHAAQLITVITMRRFQLFGHQPIALVGGGTGMIGDPSGKSAERVLNSTEVVEQWSENIKNQLKPFLDFDSKTNPALLLNNYSWLKDINILEFLRDTGKHFTVNAMLAKDSVKSRLENPDTGISFTEFSYMLLQAFDFYYLNMKYNCELQCGGSDQWGNSIAGVELIRKKLQREAFVITYPLLTTSDGRKFGKSEGNAIWIDPELTSPYHFYQFWINVEDNDVIKFLKLFTFLNFDEIKEYEELTKTAPEQREAQKRLAKEITLLVHGAEKLEQAILASNALFGAEDLRKIKLETLEQIYNTTPSIELNNLTEKNRLLDLIVEVGLTKSKSQAKEAFASGGIYVNNIKTTDINFTITTDLLIHNRFLILRRGKKNFAIIKVNFK